jgi:hypothetical protein
MILSIVIVNWNTKDYLQACLTSIQACPPSKKHEVIVVDNASTDGSAKMVKSEFPEVTLMAGKKNVGYAKGNNKAIKKADGDYILLLNPDTEVSPGAIDSLLAFARSHPDAAAVGCRLISPDGSIQRSCRSFPDPKGVLFEWLKLSSLFSRSRYFGSYRMTYFHYDCDMEVDQPMGSCLLLNRQAIKDVGYFDEDFPIFFNEVDWCYRAKQRNWRIYFTPDAEVMHFGGASTGLVKRKMAVESREALRRFYEKHYKSRMSPRLYALIMKAVDISTYLASRSQPVDK